MAHLDQRTERSAETLAVLTGLLLAALVGMGVCQFGTPPRVEWMLLLVLAIGLLGYVLAGVIGKVFAESIIDATWPASGLTPGPRDSPDFRTPPGRVARRMGRRTIGGASAPRERGSRDPQRGRGLGG